MYKFHQKSVKSSKLIKKYFGDENILQNLTLYVLEVRVPQMPLNVINFYGDDTCGALGYSEAVCKISE